MLQKEMAQRRKRRFERSQNTGEICDPIALRGRTAVPHQQRSLFLVRSAATADVVVEPRGSIDDVDRWVPNIAAAILRRIHKRAAGHLIV